MPSGETSMVVANGSLLWELFKKGLGPAKLHPVVIVIVVGGEIVIAAKIFADDIVEPEDIDAAGYVDTTTPGAIPIGMGDDVPTGVGPPGGDPEPLQAPDEEDDDPVPSEFDSCISSGRTDCKAQFENRVTEAEHHGVFTPQSNNKVIKKIIKTATEKHPQLSGRKPVAVIPKGFKMYKDIINQMPSEDPYHETEEAGLGGGTWYHVVDGLVRPSTGTKVIIDNPGVTEVFKKGGSLLAANPLIIVVVGGAGLVIYAKILADDVYEPGDIEAIGYVDTTTPGAIPIGMGDDPPPGVGPPGGAGGEEPGDPEGIQSPRDRRIANVKDAIHTKQLENRGIFKPQTNNKVARKLIKDVMKEHPDQGTPTFVVPKGSKEYNKIIKKVVGVGVSDSDSHGTYRSTTPPPPSSLGPAPLDISRWGSFKKGRPGSTFPKPNPFQIDNELERLRKIGRTGQPVGGGGGPGPGGIGKGVAGGVAGGLVIVIVVGAGLVIYAKHVADDVYEPGDIEAIGYVDTTTPGAIPVGMGDDVPTGIGPPGG